MQMHQAKPSKNGGCRLVDGRGGGGVTIAPLFNTQAQMKKRNTEKHLKMRGLAYACHMFTFMYDVV
jgi:hypothetical protein